jgi:hypothetical protein
VIVAAHAACWDGCCSVLPPWCVPLLPLLALLLLLLLLLVPLMVVAAMEE